MRKLLELDPLFMMVREKWLEDGGIPLPSIAMGKRGAGVTMALDVLECEVGSSGFRRKF